MALSRRFAPRWWLARRSVPAAPPVSATSDARLPSFLVIGAQKAGTTWLHAMLGDHPHVFMPTPKELHFFDLRRHYDRGLGWYAAHYRGAAADAVLGEATPNYLWTSDHLAAEWAKPKFFRRGWMHSVPERVRARLGSDLSLVVMLRDPVARAVSAFHHHMHVEGRLDRDAPFEELVKTWGIAHMGFYAAHLERWFEVFPRERVQVLVFEDVMAEPQPALDAVCDHIGVDRITLPPARLSERVHGGTKHRGNDGQYYYDEARTQLAISHDDLAMLRDLYAPENRRLARLLGRDLDAWSS